MQWYDRKIMWHRRKIYMIVFLIVKRWRQIQEHLQIACVVMCVFWSLPRLLFLHAYLIKPCVTMEPRSQESLACFGCLVFEVYLEI